MTHIRNLYSAFALVTALAGFCSQALAAGEEVGRVIRVNGGANLKQESAKPVALNAGDVVHVGDTVTTGVNASVQLQMEDGAIVALAAESEFKIKAYNYQPGNVLFIKDEAAANSSVNLQLQKGRLRTITGSTPKKAYSLNTPAAIVRIQGTVYDVLAKDSTTVILREGAVVVESVCNGVGTGNTQLMDIPGTSTEVAPCKEPTEPEPTDEDVDDLDEIIPEDPEDDDDIVDPEDDSPPASP